MDGFSEWSCGRARRISSRRYPFRQTDGRTRWIPDGLGMESMRFVSSAESRQPRTARSSRRAPALGSVVGEEEGAVGRRKAACVVDEAEKRFH